MKFERPELESKKNGEENVFYTMQSKAKCHTCGKLGHTAVNQSK
jgi:hypothetical protein